MVNRAYEAGWECCSMHDITGRRGIWYRRTADKAGLEVCGGREGDDDYVVIYGSEAYELENIFQTGAWMLEEAEERTEFERYFSQWNRFKRRLPRWLVRWVFGSGRLQYICLSCDYHQYEYSPESDMCYRCGADNWEEAE